MLQILIKKKLGVLDLQQRKYNLEQSGLAVHEHLGRRDEPAVCNNEAISRFHLPSQSACLVRAHFPRPGKKRSARQSAYFIFYTEKEERSKVQGTCWGDKNLTSALWRGIK